MKMYIFAIIPSVVSFGVSRYINEKSNFDGFHWSKYKKKKIFFKNESSTLTLTYPTSLPPLYFKKNLSNINITS